MAVPMRATAGAPEVGKAVRAAPVSETQLSALCISLLQKQEIVGLIYCTN